MQKCSEVRDDMYLYEIWVLLGKFNLKLVDNEFSVYGVSFWLFKTLGFWRLKMCVKGRHIGHSEIDGNDFWYIGQWSRFDKFLYQKIDYRGHFGTCLLQNQMASQNYIIWGYIQWQRCFSAIYFLDKPLRYIPLKLLICTFLETRKAVWNEWFQY